MGSQCNIANLPLLTLLNEDKKRNTPYDPHKEQLQQEIDANPFEDVDVDDEDYTQSFESEDEEKEAEEKDSITKSEQ